MFELLVTSVVMIVSVIFIIVLLVNETQPTADEVIGDPQ